VQAKVSVEDGRWPVIQCFYVQNVTLLELMDEDDVVQECKSQNKKLVDL